MRVACHARPAASDEEIEIGSLVRLLHMFDIEPEPATIWERRRCPLLPTRGESSVLDLQLK